MNTSAIRVWYENGSVDEVHLPDPAFENGVAIQREFLDFANPDEGIFVERSYIGDEGEDTSDGASYRVLTERTLVVTPEELSHTLVVQSHGVEVLRREPWAKAKCGLSVTAPVELGYKSSGVNADLEWFSEALSVVLQKMRALGDKGDKAIRIAVEEAFAEDE